MVHIIYISIIIALFYWLLRAYDFANKKHQELKRFMESNKVPYEIFSHYEKAYINFYKWMDNHGISKNIIDVYEHIFKYDK